jgi:HlyD family secretion protein
MTTRSALRRHSQFVRSQQPDPIGAAARLTPARRRRLGAIALALPPVLFLTACTSEESRPLAVKVARASVTSTVTATGSLQAISEQKLGFPDSGKLVELNVAVGQQVEEGQVLARLDDFDARQLLGSARAQVAQEQAVLARIRNGNQVAAADGDVAQANEVLKATEERAGAVDDANGAAVEQAERRLELDREALESVEDRTSDECGSDGEDYREDDDAREGDDDAYRYRRSGRSADCSDENAAVEEAERRVEASEAAVEQAEEAQRAEEAEQELAIENARRDLAAATNEAEAVKLDRPHNIQEQASIVSQLQVDVDTAVRGIENTVLRAPAAGRIASINGVVGEFLGAGSGTTPLAPGGSVPLPNSSSGVSAGEDLGGEGNGGGSAFIVLDNADTFQLVAPFAEADAARLKPHQEVEVTFDAVPDLTRVGNVASIAPSGTDIQGVMSYYAVIVLNELDPRLADGLTASANVVVDQRENALAVPNAAIQQSGQTGVVTVLGADGSQRQVQVELGLAGDSVTQVVAGLREGDQVVVAPADEE